MFFTDAAKNLMLDRLDEAQGDGMTHGSLHTAYSTTGANEVTGGSPAYARKALTWNAAASGSKALAATLPTWDVPASTTVAWVGFWDDLSAGVFLGMVPAGGGALKPFATMDDTNDTLYSEAHGFSNAQTVVAWGTNLPPPLAAGTIYHVRDVTTDSLKLAASAGGAAIDLTDEGEGALQLIVTETFGGQGTFALTAGSVNLNFLA